MSATRIVSSKSGVQQIRGFDIWVASGKVSEMGPPLALSLAPDRFSLVSKMAPAIANSAFS